MTTIQDTNNKLSRFSWIACVVLMCYASLFFYPRWNKADTEAAISCDVSGYYWYLPSVFIYHDLKHQGFKDSILEKYKPSNTDFQQGVKTDNGNYVMKYSSGMALMYAPFFFTAHLLAGPLGYAKNGFTAPYQLAVQLGGLLISILGLWYLRKLLLLFYEDRTVALTLLLLVAASNYIELATIDSGMSHTWLFSIYVFLLLNTYYFYQAPKLKYAIRIGALVGLATLTRPTEIISCLIPLLWGLDSLWPGAIKKKQVFLAANIKMMIAAVICAGLVISLQLVYWKYASGHWIVYSYGNQGFSFLDSHFRAYTFSYRSGWLIYTPIMAFAFVGIIPFLMRQRNKVLIVLFFLFNYYIICSWDIWYYGGRAMVQSYPILLFPFAAFVDMIMSKKLLRIISLFASFIFIYMNAWIIYQHHVGELYSPGYMTRPYYWRVAGRWTAPQRTIELRDQTELFEKTPKNMKVLYVNDMEHDTGARYNSKEIINGKHSLLLKGGEEMPKVTIPFSNCSAQWVRVQATFHCNQKEWEEWKMPQFNVQLINVKGGEPNKIVKYNMIRVDRQLYDNDFQNIAIDMKLPSEHFDSLQIWVSDYFSEKEIILDDIKAWSFTE